MLRGRSIVCVSTIDWDFLWQEHQATMSIFAREGNRVLFIENTGVRAPGWKDRNRVLARLRKWVNGRGRFRSVADNVALYSPLALPFPYSPFAQRINRALVCGSIRRWLKRNRLADPIVWSFLPTQLAMDLVDLLRPTTSIYYCTDKLSETSTAARKLVPYERRFAARCDLVFASAENLVDALRPINPATHLFPIGVSLEKFEAAWRGQTPEPPDVVGLRPPLVGLVGGLRVCVDQALLATLARNRPDWSFVLVGPEQVSLAELRDISNVHLLGPKPHDAVPAYVRRFDVCLIPYVVDSFTDNISPAKLNEYLALGKPVVSTALREVCRYSETFGNVVAVATGASEFEDAIARALPDRETNAMARRRAAAEANSWQHRVEEMSELIETAERRKRAN